MVCLSHFKKTAAKSPLHFHLDRVCFSSLSLSLSHTHTDNCRKKKKPKLLPNPKICYERGRKGAEAWKDAPRASLSKSWLLGAGRALQIFWSNL